MLFCVANIFYQSLLKCLFVVVPYSYSELLLKFILHCIWVRYRSSLFQLFFINIKINSSPNYFLFVCLVYILFVCLFTFFIPMLSWCLKHEQSRCTQWTVGVPKLGHKPLVKWEGGGSNRVAMGQQWGGDVSGEFFFFFLTVLHWWY